MSNYLSSPTHAIGDPTPPTLSSVDFDKAEADVGEIVTVSVVADDPESGIQYCYVSISGSSDEYLADIFMSFNSTTGVCTGTFEVDQYWPSYGYIYFVELANNENMYSYFYDMDGDYPSAVVNFRNTSPFSPLLHSLDFQSTYLYVGQDLTIIANVTDPDSSISYCYTSINGPTGYVDSIYMNYDIDSGLCIGNTQVDGSWPSPLTLNYLEVGNNANIYTYFYPVQDFNSSSVTIDYTDIFAPEIDSEFDYNYEFQGDNWITVNSNEAGYGYVYLDGMQIADLTFASPDSFWFYTNNYEDGEHNLTIWVSDYSGNSAQHYYLMKIRNDPTYIETYSYTYDYNNDGIDDEFSLESRIDYSFNDWTYVEAILIIERYDPNMGNYSYYDQVVDGRDLMGDSVDWFYHYFDAAEEGDYKFTIQYYVNFQYLESDSKEYYHHLGPQYASEFYWDLFADEDDKDGNGEPDHIQFVLRFNYENLAPYNVEINAQVMYNDQNHSAFSESFHLEGWGDYEIEFDFQAEEDAQYYFMFEVFVNGEHHETRDFSWDGHRFDPNANPTTSDPGSNSENPEDESSAAPELPVPAGSFYLFLFAIFASTIVLRRRQN